MTMRSGRVCLRCELLCRRQELAIMTQEQRDAVEENWATRQQVKRDVKHQNKAGGGTGEVLALPLRMWLALPGSS